MLVTFDQYIGDPIDCIIEEIPEEVREQMTFHPVMTVQEVLDRALEPARDVAQV